MKSTSLSKRRLAGDRPVKRIAKPPKPHSSSAVLRRSAEEGRSPFGSGIPHHAGMRVTFFSRHGIIAAAAPRMASGQPFEGQPTPFERPVFAQRLDGVLRTSRGKTARRRRKRRNAVLVDLHEDDQRQSRRTPTSVQQSVPESSGRHVRSFYRTRPLSRSR